SVSVGAPAITFTWYRGTAVAKTGADSSYRMTPPDAGAVLSVRVDIQSNADPACQASSGPVPVVPKVAPGVYAAPGAVIGGLAQVGRTLTARVGGFGAVRPDQVTQRWYRGAKRISKATGPEYTLVAADLGQAITVEFTAAGVGYEKRVVRSAPTRPVAPALFKSKKPRIKGAVRIGVELQALIGSLSSTKKPQLASQWYRNGKRISVRITASRKGFKTLAATSGRTKKVPKKPDHVDERCMSGSVICIDKNPNDRKVRWMVNGKVKLVADARFGASSTPTREGVFKVFLKSRDHWSDLYDSSMPFSMFFSGGQAVHYSSDFRARGYNGASHGCVNMRDRGVIEKIFNQVKVGTKVVVYH
ncbi:MAG: L,D-transpeptidase, partial [Bifidobacteriaceae bacterium]|nr:L,D-transpeptidase [Bifidobacteriaceae bacterium]